MFASVVIVRALVAELQKVGARDALGVEEGVLLDSNAWFSFHELSRFVERTAVLCGDPALGLTIGTTAPMHMLQVFGQLLLSCRTLRDACRLLVRYAPLVVEGVSWRLLEGEANVHLLFKHDCTSVVGARFASELVFALGRRVIRHYAPRSTAPTLVAKHERPLRALVTGSARSG